ncbi:hypothetical protein ACEPAI_2674 [Sanghuangporus weigelae]
MSLMLRQQQNCYARHYSVFCLALDLFVLSPHPRAGADTTRGRDELVKGYIKTEAELVGVYALCFVSPVTCLAVVLRATVGGREVLKRMWDYKEDWTGKEELEVEAGVDTIVKNVDDVENEGKVSISEKNYDS